MIGLRTRGAIAGLVLTAVALPAAGCDGNSSPYVPDTTYATTGAPTGVATSTSPVAALVGVWERSTDTMSVVIRISGDGSYRSVEVYTPVEAGGVYKLTRTEDGSARADSQNLQLVGRTASLARRATDDTAGNYDKPTPTRTGVYTWEVDGDNLHLVDAGGVDAVFTRAP